MISAREIDNVRFYDIDNAQSATLPRRKNGDSSPLVKTEVDYAHFCDQRFAHRAHRGDFRRSASRHASAARLVRPDRYSADLVLHRSDRLAALGNPFHNYDDNHHRWLVAQTPHGFAEFSRGGGVHHSAVGPATTFWGELSTFIFRRAKHRAAHARISKASAKTFESRSVAAAGTSFAVAQTFGFSTQLCDHCVCNFAGGVSGFIAACRLLFSSRDTSQFAGEFRHRPPQQFRAHGQSRQFNFRKLVSVHDGTFQSRWLVFHETHGGIESLVCVLAVGIFLRSCSIDSRLLNLLSPAVHDSKWRAAETGQTCRDNLARPWGDGVLSLELARRNPHLEDHHSSTERWRSRICG
jgi:hypothetical protein